MGGVVKTTALHIHVGCLFEHGHQPVGRSRHPGLRQLLIVERQAEHLKDVAGRGQFGEYVGRCAGPLEGVDRKTAVSLLESPGAVDAFVDHFLRCRPPAGELFRCVAAGGTVFFQRIKKPLFCKCRDDPPLKTAIYRRGVALSVMMARP